MLAFLHCDILRSHVAKLSSRLDKAGFTRQLTRFAIVEDQQMDARQ